MQVTDVAPADPLHRAGMAAARDIDAGIGAGVPEGYHNARHYCEVLLCALAIAQLATLARQEQALLLLAALLHDFHHDGGKRLYPFHHELYSLEAASPYLESAGFLEPIGLDAKDYPDLIPEAITPNFLGLDVYSTILAYRTDTLGAGKGPQSWADFWNVEKFPGRRCLRRSPLDTLEQALMADGVA
ncbi:MAG: extracellular solute-binding protein, partial [Oxalobacteraceae bacterium]